MCPFRYLLNFLKSFQHFLQDFESMANHFWTFGSKGLTLDPGFNVGFAHNKKYLYLKYNKSLRRFRRIAIKNIK